MRITFFHQVPLLIDWQGHSLPAKFVVGVEGPVDPQTGMILNLVDLQKALSEVLPANFYVNLSTPQKFLSDSITLIRAQFSKLGGKRVKVLELQLKFYDPHRAMANKGARSFHQEICYIYDGRTLETCEKLINSVHGGLVLMEGGEQWLWDFSESVAQELP